MVGRWWAEWSAVTDSGRQWPIVNEEKETRRRKQVDEQVIMVVHYSRRHGSGRGIW